MADVMPIEPDSIGEYQCQHCRIDAVDREYKKLSYDRRVGKVPKARIPSAADSTGYGEFLIRIEDGKAVHARIVEFHCDEHAGPIETMDLQYTKYDHRNSRTDIALAEAPPA